MNCSIFKQQQKYNKDEDCRISDYSDSDSEWNTGNLAALKENSNFLNTTESSFYTPAAKRFKSIPLKKTHLRTQQKTFSQSFNSRKNITCPQLETNINLLHLNEIDQNEQEAMRIDWTSSDEPNNDSINTTNITQTQQTQNFNSVSTELDLLLSLIGQEDNSKKVKKNTKTKQNLFKRCRLGGYLHQLRQILDNSKTNHKYLKHDRNFGIRHGSNLRVLKIEKSFNISIATVLTLTGDKFQVVLDTKTAATLKIGNELEAFFDESIDPYPIDQLNGENLLFLQPSKLILC